MAAFFLSKTLKDDFLIAYPMYYLMGVCGFEEVNEPPTFCCQLKEGGGKVERDNSPR